jgi:hypothetical protein
LMMKNEIHILIFTYIVQLLIFIGFDNSVFHVYLSISLFLVIKTYDHIIFFFIYINNIITVWFVVWCLWVYIFTQPDLIVLLTEIYVGTNTHSLSICILPSALVKWTFIYLLVYSSVNITYHQRNTNSSGIYINFISTLSKIYPVNNILKNILNKSTKIIKII